MQRQHRQPSIVKCRFESGHRSLQNLTPSSTYHYRIVATNNDARTYGADRTFTTPAYTNPIMQPPHQKTHEEQAQEAQEEDMTWSSVGP